METQEKEDTKKNKLKSIYFFIWKTKVYFKNKTSTPSRKRFYAKSPHLRFASGSISRKSVVLFILSIAEAFTK